MCHITLRHSAMKVLWSAGESRKNAAKGEREREAEMRAIGGLVPQKWRRPSPPPPLLAQFHPPPNIRRRELRLLPRLIRAVSTNRRLRLSLLILLAFLALIPPLFFHFRLRRFNQMRSRKCGWMESPPMVCAHGGDSSKAAPNSMDAFRIAISSQVDCIEVDVSRSSDGVLFALHDRDLQRISGNSSARVGHLSKNEIRDFDVEFQLTRELHNQKIPTAEDALLLISQSVKQVIVDVKVGPPSYEKGLAEDILSISRSTHCKNCLIWAKSDKLAMDIINLSGDIRTGYIVMMDQSTGARSDLLRIKDASVVGVYHPLIDEKLVRILHQNGKKVYAWTVEDAESMKRMLFERVDAVVTSNPSLLRSLMEELETECLQDGLP